MPRQPSAGNRPALYLLLLVAQVAGCASYQLGNATLYAPDVRTVYVPVIESDSFRRDLGERLTEAVIKEIELKTPFKVVGNPDADSILSARLVTDQKHITIENQNDDPRAVEFVMTAEVTWLNRRRTPIQPPTAIPLPPAILDVAQTSAMMAEVGQSVATAQQQAIQRLAEQIVSTMEEPW
ncbi:LPS assembly lipoprotein LptE [Pirellulales bacterium]|nr:LPS assembly lipoprotein LptE [Pirellulales bacterium]